MGFPVRWPLAALAAVVAFAAPPAPAADPAATPHFAAGTRPADVMVCVTPLGKVDGAVTTAVARGVAAAYGFRTQVVAGHPLPRAAYYRPRHRYKADRLLDFLAA